MSSVFGADYAGDYDALYGDKDYDAEVALIERVIKRQVGEARSILDLGCGTGAHTLRLAERGFAVTGVDRSLEMLAIAELKSLAAHSSALFVEGDVTAVRLGATFDVALMMFAVLGYQTTDAAARAALETARAHLREGGLFIADVWYGPAVVAIQPEERTKLVGTERGNIVRTVRTVLDPVRKCASVHYRVTHREGSTNAPEFEETHTMRYFFESDLVTLLESSGLRMVELRAFDDDTRPATVETWNVLVVARAI